MSENWTHKSLQTGADFRHQDFRYLPYLDHSSAKVSFPITIKYVVRTINLSYFYEYFLFIHQGWTVSCKKTIWYFVIKQQQLIQFMGGSEPKNNFLFLLIHSGDILHEHQYAFSLQRKLHWKKYISYLYCKTYWW